MSRNHSFSIRKKEGIVRPVDYYTRRGLSFTGAQVARERGLKSLELKERLIGEFNRLRNNLNGTLDDLIKFNISEMNAYHFAYILSLDNSVVNKWFDWVALNSTCLGLEERRYFLLKCMIAFHTKIDEKTMGRNIKRLLKTTNGNYLVLLTYYFPEHVQERNIWLKSSIVEYEAYSADQIELIVDLFEKKTSRFFSTINKIIN